MTRVPPATSPKLRAALALCSLLDIGGRIGRLAIRLAVIDLDLADAPGRFDSFLAERRLVHTDRDKRQVHRVPRPVRGTVDFFLDRREYLFSIRVADRARIVLQAHAEEFVAHIA